MRTLVLFTLLLVVGCGGGGGGSTKNPAPPTTPPTTSPPSTPPPTSPPTTPPDSSPPLDPHSGQVTLKGSGAGDGQPAPATVNMTTYANQLALVTLKATTTPSSINAPMACVGNGSIDFSVMPVTTDGVVRTFAVPLPTPGSVNLELYNRPLMTQPDYPQPVTWTYTFNTANVMTPDEPSNNDSSGETPVTAGTTQAGTFVNDPNGTTDDTDWYGITVPAKSGCTIDYTDTNGQLNPFMYSWAVKDNSWSAVAMDWDTTKAAGSMTFANTADTAQTYHIMVQGTPTQSRRTFSFAQYWLKQTVTTFDAPAVITIAPDGGEAGPAWKQATFTATVNPSVTSYNWNFGQGAAPAVSTQASPTENLADAGTYTGTLTVSNAVGASVSKNFTYTVTPGIPHIAGITPSDASGEYGKTVQFSANATGNPTSWNWTFAQGDSPQTSTDASPSVTLSQLGEQQVTVQATNALGTSAPVSFYLAITPAACAPIVQSVTFGGGCPGSTVAASAAVSGCDTFTYSWDFGQGATPSISTDPNPTVTLSGTPGTYQAVLSMSNADGPGAPYSFTYVIQPSAPACWDLSSVTPPNEGGTHPRAVMLNGRPAIAYVASSGALRVALALTDTPRGPNDWTIEELAPGIGGMDLTVLNGRLAIAFTSVQSGQLLLALATADDPTIADWTLTPILTDTAPATANVSVAANNGLLAVAFTDGYNAPIELAQATVAQPQGLSDWTVSSPESGATTGGYCSLVTTADGLAVAYVVTMKALHVARSLVQNPVSDSDWTVVTIDPSTMANYPVSLTEADGLLAVASQGWDKQIRFARATVADPTSSSDWAVSVVTGDYGASNPSLSLVNGDLAVSYANGSGFLSVGWANSTAPSTSADWTIQSVGVTAPALSSQLIDNNGKGLIAFAGYTGITLASAE